MFPSLVKVVRRCPRIRVPLLAPMILAGKGVRGRPTTAVLAVALLLLVGTGLGVYLHALRQWHAAESAVKEGRPAEARGRLDLCLTVWPWSARVHLLAARAARLGGDLEGAEAHLNRCLELEHGATEATQLEFLLLRVQAGEVDEVVPPLLAYVDKKHAETPLILETLSGAYLRNLRYGPALDCLNRWIHETPDVAVAYYQRGWLLEHMQHSDNAMRDYRRALELDPNLLEARLRVAEMLLEKSNPPEAAPHLERLNKRFPDRADVQARLGQCRFLQGELGEARRLLEAAGDKLPNDSLLLIYLAKLDMQEDRPAQAETRLRRVLKADPYDLEAQYTLAKCLQRLGRSQEAATLQEQCEKKKARLDRAHHLLRDIATKSAEDAGAACEVGAALLRVGQERLGLYWLDQALQRDRAYQPAHQALAEYYESKGEQARAAPHRAQLAASTRKAATR